eukprot:gene6363-8763_t
MTEVEVLFDLVSTNVDSNQVKEKIQELLDTNPVIMFSKTTCPFCFELKRTLVSYGVNFAVFEVNQAQNYTEISNELATISKIKTFPNLFINKTSVGGCSDCKELEYTGKFQSVIAPYRTRPGNTEHKLSNYGLLWFPEVINGRVAQLTGLLSSIYCILCIIFYKRDATPWAVLALAIDYFLRFTFGATYSVGGSVSMALLSRIPPRFAAGPPKQFAAFCGVFFSVFGAGLYLANQRVGGAIVIAMLAAASGLEGVFDFCLGCVFFGLAINLNILPKSLYQPYCNMLQARKYAYDYTTKKRDLDHAINSHHNEINHTPVDLIRKVRQDFEYKLNDFHLIKHCRVEFFGCPMAIAALAYCFKLTSNAYADSTGRYDTGIAYEVLGIVSVILAGIVLVLYGLRFVLYPKKVIKDWRHPIYGHFFSTISIFIVLIGLLYLPREDGYHGGGALIWIGAIIQMLITVFKVAELVYTRVAEEFLSPQIMMGPVGNYIAAVGFCVWQLDYSGDNHIGKVNYVELARLWFGVASLFAITFFVITFRKSVLDHHSENRSRPTLFIWLATSSIVGPAYYAVSAYDAAVGNGVFYQSMWCISLFFFVIVSYGMVFNFYTYEKDMGIWIVPFSFSAFALNTIQYDRIIGDVIGLFNVLSIITLTIASVSTAVCGATTLSWVCDLTLFLPRNKWGPISFMKLTHEAIRFYLPKLGEQLSSVSAENTNSLKSFLVEFNAFQTMFMEHSQHEDLVVFPAARRFFPGFNAKMDKDHEALHTSLDAIVAQVARINGAFSETGENDVEGGHRGVLLDALGNLTTLVPAFAALIEPHLEDEENSVTCIARKYFSIELQMEISRKVFDLTSIDNWRVVMPFVISNLPIPMWKVRYVKTFVWAYPFRAQEIGLILYHGLDDVTWLFLSREIPELVPRGLYNHKRIY